MERAVDKPKVLFSYINSRLKNKETVLVLKGENNEDIIENDAKAENLSRLFVSVFTEETDFDEAGLPAGTTSEITENIDFTEEDVRKELLALKEEGRYWLQVALKNQFSLLVGCVYRPLNANDNLDRILSLAFHAAADLGSKYQLVADDLELPKVRWSPPSDPRMFDEFLEAVDVGM
nr:unnamed protein product [Spirometra erinaceieuropaei]